MDLICEWAMAAVGLDAEVAELVSVSTNATEAGSHGASAGTRVLIILTGLLLLVWNQAEKTRVPGGLVTSLSKSLIFRMNSGRNTFLSQVHLSVWVLAHS